MLRYTIVQTEELSADAVAGGDDDDDTDDNDSEHECDADDDNGEDAEVSFRMTEPTSVEESRLHSVRPQVFFFRQFFH